MAKEKTARARVLTDCAIDGASFKCNQVVEIDEEIIKKHRDYFDDSKKGVEYCVKELGAEVIQHASSDTPE